MTPYISSYTCLTNKSRLCLFSCLALINNINQRWFTVNCILRSDIRCNQNKFQIFALNELHSKISCPKWRYFLKGQCVKSPKIDMSREFQRMFVNCTIVRHVYKKRLYRRKYFNALLLINQSADPERGGGNFGRFKVHEPFFVNSLSGEGRRYHKSTSMSVMTWYQLSMFY